MTEGRLISTAASPPYQWGDHTGNAAPRSRQRHATPRAAGRRRALDGSAPPGPAAKRFLWGAVNRAAAPRPSGGGTAAVVASRYRRWIEHISAAVQAALYYSHCRLLALCVKPDDG